jgi:hypothetical protein
MNRFRVLASSAPRRAGNDSSARSRWARSSWCSPVRWYQGVTWWVVGIEGAVVTLAGLCMIVAPDSARDIVRQLLAAGSGISVYPRGT